MNNVIRVNFKKPRKKTDFYSLFWVRVKIISSVLLLATIGIIYIVVCVWAVYGLFK